MPRVRNHLPVSWNLNDLLEDLGKVSPTRIRINPGPGTATEADIVRIEEKEGRLYELVDGTLVEKIMGAKESYLAIWLTQLFAPYFIEKDPGFLLGADGALRLMPGLVRIPDLSIILWNQLPKKEIPDESIPDLAPALAVEVLSKANTKGEMKRKLKEYFLAGVKLVWFIDPEKRSVQVFTAPDKSTLLREDQTLDGGKVLPGFSLPLMKLFERLSAAPKSKTAKAKTSNGNSRKKPKSK